MGQLLTKCRGRGGKGKIAVPPENKDSNTFTVIIDDWDINQDEFLSPVYRINGYPWRLQIFRSRVDPKFNGLTLICDKSSEAELWKCTATIKLPLPEGFQGPVEHVQHTFKSWDKYTHRVNLAGCVVPLKGFKLQIEIATEEDGNSWRLCPVFDRSVNPYDFFNEQFLKENPIGDVEGEELFNIFKLLYRLDGAYLSERNVDRILQLADRLGLKIVEDRAVSYLLSRSSSLSIVDICHIADQYNLCFLKDNLLASYSKAQVIRLCDSAKFDQLSHDSLKVLFNKVVIDASTDVSLSRLHRYYSRIALSKITHEMDDVSLSRLHRYYSRIAFSKIPHETDESNKISMVVKDFGKQKNQFSSVYRINGFPWRLRIDMCSLGNNKRRTKGSYLCDVYVICDKSNEAELWKCAAAISSKFSPNLAWRNTHIFTSWGHNTEQMIRESTQLEVGSILEVIIATDVDGEIYCRRPFLDPLEPRDGILVFENTKKFEVNKKSLADRSFVFDRIFYGNFKEKDMKEIPIGDVEYEEFSNLMDVQYGKESEVDFEDLGNIVDEVLYVLDDNKSRYLCCKNAGRMLELANRFELKTVEDRVVSFMLSSSSFRIALPTKLLMADRFYLAFLMDALLSQLNSIDQLKELSESRQWNHLSKETLRILFKKFCIMDHLFADVQ